MDQFCRLCAISKPPEEIKCEIDDRIFDIERKLVTCCNWNSFRSHENLSKSVCISCYLQLELLWYYHESVSRAQQKLLKLINVDVKQLPLNNGTEQAFESKTGNESLNLTEFKIETTFDEPGEYCDVIIENTDGRLSNTYDTENDDSSNIEQFSEENLLVEMPVVKPQKVQRRARKSTGVRNKTSFKSKVKNTTKNKKKTTKNTLKFNLRTLFSSKDADKDGMIKSEKVLEKNICNWNAINYRCYKCNDNFSSHSSLWEHFSKSHSDKKYQLICSMCQEKVFFQSNREYRNHITKSHLPHLTYCCYECNKFFIDMAKVRRHFRSHPSYVCSTCGKAFCYKSNLDFHQLTHQSIELQFECHVCRESLLSYQSLRIHMKSHTRVKNVKPVKSSTKLSEQKKQNLKQAWDDVKAGKMTIYGASKKYNIPYSTLWDWCNRTVVDGERPSVGRPSFLGSDLENELKRWILEAVQTGFPISQKQVRWEASKYNEERGLVDGWQPGKKWYIGFINRNPEIKRNIRTRNEKSQLITELDVRQWYQKTVNVASEMDWRNANKIFSMDEISFCLNPNLRKVLMKRNHKCMKNQRDCCTVLLGGNAAGRQIPPLIIFEGKRLPNEINQILPRGWQSECSTSSWMNSNIFFNYISKTFYPWLLTEDISTPVVLFVEGHINHRSLQLSDFCSQHKIILVSFLPNTSHIGQPIDVLANGHLKHVWESKLTLFKNMHSDLDRMPHAVFCDLLNKCLKESLNEYSFQESFRTTAIFPFDPSQFDYSKLSISTSQ